MNDALYNRMLSSIYNEVRDIINEQFNVNDLDFNSESEYNTNIFNKKIINPYEIYDKIMNDDADICNDDIRLLNDFTSEVQPGNTEELRKIIVYYSDNYPKYSLNWIDVSECINMMNIFKDTTYDGDISLWDVSNVKTMEGMFIHAAFNQDISEWDVSNVKTMEGMFIHAAFNQDISDWNVSNV